MWVTAKRAGKRSRQGERREAELRCECGGGGGREVACVDGNLESRASPQLCKMSHGRWPNKYCIHILRLRAVRDYSVLYLAGSLC